MSGGVSAATIASYAGIAAAGATILSQTGVLGGKKSAGTPPPIAPPAVMPTPDDEAVKKAHRRSLIEQQARSGRASTIFDDGDRLGG